MKKIKFVLLIIAIIASTTACVKESEYKELVEHCEKLESDSKFYEDEIYELKEQVKESSKKISELAATRDSLACHWYYARGEEYIPAGKYKMVSDYYGLFSEDTRYVEEKIMIGGIITDSTQSDEYDHLYEVCAYNDDSHVFYVSDSTSSNDELIEKGKYIQVKGVWLGAELDDGHYVGGIIADEITVE